MTRLAIRVFLPGRQNSLILRALATRVGRLAKVTANERLPHRCRIWETEEPAVPDMKIITLIGSGGDSAVQTTNTPQIDVEFRKPKSLSCPMDQSQS